MVRQQVQCPTASDSMLLQLLELTYVDSAVLAATWWHYQAHCLQALKTTDSRLLQNITSVTNMLQINVMMLIGLRAES